MVAGKAFVLVPACALVSVFVIPAFGVSVDVPGGSFETPSAAAFPYARPEIDHWQKAPTPVGWTSEQWEQTAGVFLNIGNPPIDNVDGPQAAFLFSVPGVTLFQDLGSQFEAGEAYDLIVAAAGGGNPTYTSPIRAGATLELRLYYRDLAGNPIVIGQHVVTSPQDNYPITHLTDYALHLDAVPAEAAGKNIGVQLISTVDPALAGGYWDIDNVRLTVTPEPTTLMLLGLAVAGLVRRRS